MDRQIMSSISFWNLSSVLIWVAYWWREVFAILVFPVGDLTNQNCRLLLFFILESWQWSSMRSSSLRQIVVLKFFQDTGHTTSIVNLCFVRPPKDLRDRIVTHASLSARLVFYSLTRQATLMQCLANLFSSVCVISPVSSCLSWSFLRNAVLSAVCCTWSVSKPASASSLMCDYSLFNNLCNRLAALALYRRHLL